MVCNRLDFPKGKYKCKGHGRNIKGKRWDEEFELTEEEYGRCIDVEDGMTECWMIPMTEKIKPIYFMTENGVDLQDKKAVKDSIKTIFKLAGVEKKIKIFDYSELSGTNYKSLNGSLKEYKTVDWYLQKGKETSRNSMKLNANAIYSLCCEEIALSGYKHYYVLILKSYIYGNNTNFVIGSGGKGTCAIISTYRFNDLEPDLKYEVIKTVTMHEVGHVLGIPNKNRKINVENNLGWHCTNKCVMRQGLCVPDDWIKMTNDRIKSVKPLCNECINDLFVF